MLHPTNQKSEILTENSMDVVIPVAVKDLPKLSTCIKQISQNYLTPIHKNYVVTKPEICAKKLHFEQPVVWMAEETYPFQLTDIENFFDKKGNPYQNRSWYYQQLLKFYVFKAIPNLLPNTLILDADFFINKPLNFLTQQGQAILSYGYPFKWLLNTKNYPTENDHSHIDFACRFVPQWFPVNSFSGMHHHMIFHKEIITKLFSLVENYHQKEFWQAFLDNVEVQKWNAASEYAIYYHLAMQFFPEKVISRNLIVILFTIIKKIILLLTWLKMF